LDSQKIANSFNEYLSNDGLSVSQKEFIANIEDKISNSDFIGDITALIRPGIEYNANTAWNFIKSELIEKFH